MILTVSKGAPRKWKPLNLPMTVPKTGLEPMRFMPDPSLSCEHPLEPLFRALSIMDSKVDFYETDMITDRINLWRLFRFAQGNTQSFRIKLSVIHNILLLTTAKHDITPTTEREFRSKNFGYNFEQTFTVSELSSSSGNHLRAIRYALGKINCVVRSEIDAWYNEECDLPAGVIESDRTQTPDIEDEDHPLDSLANSRYFRPENERNKMNVNDGGHTHSCSAMVEIKTKRIDKGPGKPAMLSQVWFSRTPYLFIGKHIKGTFRKIQRIHAAA